MADQVDTTNFISHEKIPDEWPEEFPGITNFEPPLVTNLQFDASDVALINNLANLAPGALVDELKAIKNIACRLAIDEEREKTRGKILRVLLD